MSSQQNDARVAGVTLAKSFVDEFEATNQSPSKAQRDELGERWSAFLATQHSAAYGIYENLYLEAANLHFEGRMTFHSKHRSIGGVTVHGHGDAWHDGRPRAHPERGWSGSFGISRGDSK